MSEQAFSCRHCGYDLLLHRASQGNFRKGSRFMPRSYALRIERPRRVSGLVALLGEKRFWARAARQSRNSTYKPINPSAAIRSANQVMGTSQGSECTPPC